MKTKERLFVDCQVFQHNTWNRGMGRYTLKLLEALDKEPVELILLLNKNISIHSSRLQAIKQACPSATIKYLRLSEDPNKHGGWRRLQEVCQAELDKQLAGMLKPTDTYVITSNFSIRYCSTFPGLDCKKALIFYDLTPYLHWDDYKNTPDFEPKKYFAQFRTVFVADQLWAISQSAADEATHWLGIDERKVVNIRGASIRNLEEESTKPKTVPSNGKFLLSPSADGPNKNNENMVRAFAEFNAKVKNKYKLVITSDFSSQSKDMLRAISPDLVFSGHITDGELGWLYEHCEALLFVSKTEGLGLPILEAVGAGKKVVCSDIKVFKEISEKAFYFADPFNVQTIADALTKALVAKETWDDKKQEYSEISTVFSWAASARMCVRLASVSHKVIRQKTAGSATAIWYADSDRGSLSRDIAEVLYALYPSATFHSMRALEYTYALPSYLLDMGVASHALETVEDQPAKQVYIIDDSKEGAQLLLRALDRPGRIIAGFSKAKIPKSLEAYVNQLFGGNLSYKKLIELVKLAGNTIDYRISFSPRGEKQFIKEVTAIGEAVIKGETR